MLGNHDHLSNIKCSQLLDHGGCTSQKYVFLDMNDTLDKLGALKRHLVPLRFPVLSAGQKLHLYDMILEGFLMVWHPCPSRDSTVALW